MENKDLRMLSDGVINELTRLNYNPYTIKNYKNKFNEFIAFAKQHGKSCFSEELGLMYLEELYQYSEKKKEKSNRMIMSNALRIVRLLGDYNLHEAILKRNPRSKQLIINPVYKELFDEYKEDCIEHGYSNSTIKCYEKTADKFLSYLETHNLPKPSEITQLQVSGYVNTLVGYSYKSNELYLCALRSFLKFLYNKGYHKTCLVKAIPKIIHRKYCKIPSVWKKGDVEKLLNSIDRGNQSGKRDYAIILIIARLGIRAVDIKNLKFEHLNWKEKKIEFVQTKTKNKISLPLLPDVGWAIIDYLQNGRPKVKSPYVFLRHKVPVDPFEGAHGLYGVILKHMKLAGIPVQKDKPSGTHSLRHTLACALLERHTPLSTISEILGHVSTETTDLYLMTGVDMLRECSLRLKEVDE